MRRDYLPTQPLLPLLRRRVDPQLLGRGGFRSGVRELAEQLNAITGNRLDANTRSDERLLVRILRGEVTFIRDVTADAIAQALGLHPTNIWSEWEEIDYDDNGWHPDDDEAADDLDKDIEDLLRDA